MQQMPDLRPIPRPEAPTASARTTAEVLTWQSRVRLGIALFVGITSVAALLARVIDRIPMLAAVLVTLYIAVTAAVGLYVRRRGQAGRSEIIVTLVADLVIIFGITFLAMPPLYYSRALLFAFVTLHLTEFYVGRRFAGMAMLAVSVVYLLMVSYAIGHGAPLSWAQEIVTLLAFLLAGGSFIYHYGTFRERLASIVQLFQRAESGDLSAEFDLARETRPDSITLVGRAYNQMRAQLATMVSTDPLSGCLNRRGLDQHLSREIARAVRSGNEIALVMVDIDNFKLINDSFGHLAGDAVVREVGAMLRELARGGDIVARTGGDEFSLLLPETNTQGAYRLAQRVREAIAKRQFEGVQGRIPITASIGLVADRAVDEDIAHDLHSRADEALYAAKGQGRNNVTIWSTNIRTFAVQRASKQVLS
jgi:diguanylate cyclase (GGDEF)-like protein